MSRTRQQRIAAQVQQLCEEHGTHEIDRAVHHARTPSYNAKMQARMRPMGASTPEDREIRDTMFGVTQPPEIDWHRVLKRATEIRQPIYPGTFAYELERDYDTLAVVVTYVCRMPECGSPRKRLGLHEPDWGVPSKVIELLAMQLAYDHHYCSRVSQTCPRCATSVLRPPVANVRTDDIDVAFLFAERQMEAWNCYAKELELERVRRRNEAWRKDLTP
jgi:hypothetical protein